MAIAATIADRNPHAIRGAKRLANAMPDKPMIPLTSCFGWKSVLSDSAPRVSRQPTIVAKTWPG